MFHMIIRHDLKDADLDRRIYNVFNYFLLFEDGIISMSSSVSCLTFAASAAALRHHSILTITRVDRCLCLGCKFCFTPIQPLE
jgi:hypothetical protein